jgi:hypothetical protein
MTDRLRRGSFSATTSAGSGWAGQSIYVSVRIISAPAGPTPDEIRRLKRLYRRAAKAFHPDLGGSAERMAEVNDAYARGDLAALERLVDGH